jgi:hypothetical protein
MMDTKYVRCVPLLVGLTVCVGVAVTIILLYMNGDSVENAKTMLVADLLGGLIGLLAMFATHRLLVKCGLSKLPINMGDVQRYYTIARDEVAYLFTQSPAISELKTIQHGVLLAMLLDHGEEFPDLVYSSPDQTNKSSVMYDLSVLVTTLATHHAASYNCALPGEWRQLFLKQPLIVMALEHQLRK